MSSLRLLLLSVLVGLVFAIPAKADSCPPGINSGICTAFPSYTNAAPGVTTPAPTDRIPYVQGPTTHYVPQSPWTVGNLPPTAVTGDGYEVGGFTSNTYTAEQIADWVFCNCTNTPVSTDAIRGVGQLTAGSTIDLVNGVAGYVVADVPISGAFPASVALFGMGIADVNNSNIWGVNTAVSDNKGQVISAGTGKTIYGAEFDVNVTSPSTNIFGAVVQGASLSQPGISNGWVCGPLSFANSGIQWGSCLQSDDLVTDVAVNIGVEGSIADTGPWPPAFVAGRGSQFIEWGYVDFSAARQGVLEQVSVESGNAGGLPSLTINNLSTPLTVGVYLPKGGFSTGDTNLITNGLVLGAQAASGTSVNSQTALFAYFDAAGVKQNINLRAVGGATPTLALLDTAGGAPVIQIGGTLGVTCSGSPTSSFASIGGVITHC